MNAENGNKNKTEITADKPQKKGNIAKECAYIAVFVALVIAVQLALAAVPVEFVTLLFVCYAYVFGVKRGAIAATAFALLRQLLFGFFPVVLILYLWYYNFLAVLFGFLGKKIGRNWRFLPLLVVLACVCTVLFTMSDNLLTPLWYGYSRRAARYYFYASLPFMIPQTIGVAVSTALLFMPLTRTFSLIKRGL